MVIHQPDQAGYRSVLPDEIDWKPFPAFPPSARPGNRRRRSIGTRAIRHPGQAPLERQADAAPAPGGPRDTVISGVFYIGLGSVFDEERLQAYPPGAVIVLPGGTPHFHGRNLEPTSPKYGPWTARPRIHRPDRDPLEPVSKGQVFDHRLIGGSSGQARTAAGFSSSAK